MRTATSSYGVSATNIAIDRSATVEWQDPASAIGDPAHAETEAIVRRSPVSHAVRVVGMLAFGQSLLFLLLWLFVCASAGATPAKPADFKPILQQSTYTPTKARDPLTRSSFKAAESTSVAISPAAFQLEGILYDAANPSAIVNGKLVAVNKSVTLTVGEVDIPVKATAITRRSVTLDVNGQKVELRLDGQNPAVAP